MLKRKAVFLDRDGVINRVVMRGRTPGSPRRLREFRLRRGAAGFVRRLAGRGFAVFIVTNQPDVARGLLDPAELEKMHDRIRRSMPVDEILACTHDDRDLCSCRKPLPGLIVSAAGEHGINLTRSFVLGDGGRDMAAGGAAGCTTILLRTEYNRGVEADHRARSFAEAEKIICGRGKGNRAFRSRGPFRSAG
jgi:D-glycero-D-manno-heptose 1,7-bisphosphate phosphatase